MSTLTRQPFGLVNDTRLRNLKNIKNQQNAFVSTASKSLKRARDAGDSDNDSENIDPAIYLSSIKKFKGTDGLSKPKFFLNGTPAISNVNARPIATPKRLAVATIKAKPIAAAKGGRSPIKNRGGILSRRRNSPFVRTETPKIVQGTTNGMPFSIDAALSGTIPSTTSAPVAVVDGDMPGKWFFNIHEDTLDDELSNLVEHSTQHLDISDDEGKISQRDDRGKENIPPTGIAVMTPVSRRDVMTEEVRTPLGDLLAEEYYAAGCDANSIILVPEGHEISFAFDAEKKTESSIHFKDTNGSSIEAEDASNDIVKTEGPIEVWESESAKGDESEATAAI